ncbi:methyltransferase [Pigmentiphaga sp. CHJ604]|uniref:class I SAM-dependent methyltransferase n=1 Tax=Pigmentiphaga sp. CHJ604 TaxID=3081984 RepID=UPI0030CAA7C3
MSFKALVAVVGVSLLGAGCAVAPVGEDTALKQAIASPARTPAFVARDAARKPYEVLHFFELRPDATVVEISPGAGYWTEILAPYLKPRGTYYAAQYPQDGGGRAYYQEYYRNFRAKLDANPAWYDRVRVTAFGKGRYDIAPPGSADIVLTFRNLHNWMNDGYAEEVMAAFYRALKPGGILGIEAHRGRADKPQDPRAADGYVRQDYAIQLARQAGFVFVGSSEALANPRDTKDHPAGVWTLPPTFRLGDKDRERYAAIGEADGFLLKFRKP